MSPEPRIAILDYGMGNLRSVQKALERVGAAPEVTDDAAEIGEADALVLPGVGAFPKAMEEVRRRGLDELVVEAAERRVPILGICLGMQLLFRGSTELGGAQGIGLLDGEVDVLGASGLKLPQIGWNHVRWRRPSPLTAGLPDPCAFYHVHSYAPRPAESDDSLGVASYGAPFSSAVEREPVWGVQFHPEKSGAAGLALLRNFVAIAAGGAAEAGAEPARPAQA